MDELPSGTLTLLFSDVEGRLALANAAAGRTMGVDFTALIGQPMATNAAGANTPLKAPLPSWCKEGNNVRPADSPDVEQTNWPSLVISVRV